MIARSLEGFSAFFQPLGRVARSFAPLQAKALLRVGLFGVVASGLNAMGFLVLVPLIDFAVKGRHELALGPWLLTADEHALILLVGIAVALAIGSLRLGYLNHRLALEILRGTATEAAVRGLLMIGDLEPGGKRKRAVNQLMGVIAFACGMLMRQLATGLSDMLELLVFLSVLLWLSPGLTLVFLVGILIAGFLYARSLTGVADTVHSSQTLAASARADLNRLAKESADPALSPTDLRKRVHEMYRSGPFSELVEGKLHIRQEMKRGPMLLEYLFPVALVVFPLLLISGGDNFTDTLGPVIVYVLVLRKVIGLLQRLAGLLMFVGKLHPSILCYADLQQGRIDPRCQFDNKSGDNAESDDD